MVAKNNARTFVTSSKDFYTEFVKVVSDSKTSKTSEI